MCLLLPIPVYERLHRRHPVGNRCIWQQIKTLAAVLNLFTNSRCPNRDAPGRKETKNEMEDEKKAKKYQQKEVNAANGALVDRTSSAILISSTSHFGT